MPKSRPFAPAELSLEQMKAAIQPLKRRRKELGAIDVSQIRDRDDPMLEALEKKLETTLADIFGNHTAEYFRFHVRLDQGPPNFRGKITTQDVRDGFKKGIDQAILNLSTIIDLFAEKLADAGETAAGKALRAFGEFQLHPEIERAAADLFRNGHYANAVEDACKILNLLVKVRSKRDDLDGVDLMQSVFSPNKPILKFSEIKTRTEKDEQQGMMFLYAGAMYALRNPRAHEILEDDPEMALDYIAFISLLAKALDKTKLA